MINSAAYLAVQYYFCDKNKLNIFSCSLKVFELQAFNVNSEILLQYLLYYLHTLCM